MSKDFYTGTITATEDAFEEVDLGFISVVYCTVALDDNNPKAFFKFTVYSEHKFFSAFVAGEFVGEPIRICKTSNKCFTDKGAL